MKPLVLPVLALSMLSACTTPETRTAVDASRYLFDLDISVNSELARFDPDVSKGSGSGAARGAGMGFGACIMGPLQGSGGSDPGAALLVMAAGIFISPACALVGSIVGSGMAETKEDVAARTAVLNNAASALDYPGSLATLLSHDLTAGPIYKIHQPSDEITLVLPETAVTPIAVTNVEDKEAEPPTDPNGSIRIHISHYGLSGGGVDPKMPLRMIANLCVTEYQSGSALVSRSFFASSKARKLEDWAALGQDGLETETLALVHRISAQVQGAIGRQVRLDYKPSCN